MDTKTNSSNPHDHQNITFDTWDKIFEFQGAKDGANYKMLMVWLKNNFDVPDLLPPGNGKAKFTYFPKEKNWCGGVAGEFSFEAKLFDSSSHFGINEGRVSKLWIQDNKGKCLVNYDRGWDVKPKTKVKEAYDAIMDLLENAPKRF